MSAMQKVKVEPVDDDYGRTESIECIENNIKKEPEDIKVIKVTMIEDINFDN
jgi:hypothetical protein